MTLGESLLVALQSIALAFGIILLGVIVGKWMFIHGSIRADLRDFIFRLATGTNRAAQVIVKLHEWAVVATTDGVLGLIGVPQSESNVMAGKGLQLVLTGKDSGELRAALDEDVKNSLLMVDKAVSKVKLLGYFTFFSALISTMMGAMLCLWFSDMEKLWLLGLYTVIMSLSYVFLLITPVLILLVKGLRSLSTEIQLECELVITGLSMIAEGERAETVTDRLQQMAQSPEQTSG